MWGNYHLPICYKGPTVMFAIQKAGQEAQGYLLWKITDVSKMKQGKMLPRENIFL